MSSKHVDLKDAAYNWCPVIRCKHQRSDRGDAGDGADSGLLRGLLGGGWLPHQGRSRYRARMLHSSHGGCARGTSGAGQVPAGCWWGYCLKSIEYIILHRDLLVLTVAVSLFLGANVHATTATGDTALTYACENGHTDVADVLLQTGADLVRLFFLLLFFPLTFYLQTHCVMMPVLNFSCLLFYLFIFL